MKYTLDINSKCIEALPLLNENKGKGLVVLEDNKPVGFITDGDIRRFLVEGGDLSSGVDLVMTKDFVKLTKKPNYVEASNLLERGIKLVPIVSANNNLLDILDIKSILHIPIHDPRLVGNELEYLLDCIDTNWISSQGIYVKKFEKLFSSFHDNLYTTTTSSGTSALELAFKAIKSKRKGYVLVPDLTFGATLNAVINSGLTPIICPIKADNFAIDLSSVPHEILNDTAAVCVVHLYGSVVDMKDIIHLKEQYNFFIVEDCAQALGTKINGNRAGTIGDISAFSFFGNKLITTGEGGMLITNNKDFYDFINLIKNHGMSNTNRYWHTVVGTNARMTNIQAAIGLAQLESLDSVVIKKRSIHSHYHNRLSKLEPMIKIWHEFPGMNSSYWLNTIMINDKEKIAKLLSEAARNHIDLRRCFYPMHSLPAFRNYAIDTLDYSHSVSIYNQLICLPSGLNLEFDSISKVCDTIVSIIN